MKEKEFPTITKDNIGTWNDIVYSWLICGMMLDKNRFEQPPKYGEMMRRADNLTQLLFNALRKQMKAPAKCIYCKRVLGKKSPRYYHQRCGKNNG